MAENSKSAPSASSAPSANSAPPLNKPASEVKSAIEAESVTPDGEVHSHSMATGGMFIMIEGLCQEGVKKRTNLETKEESAAGNIAYFGGEQYVRFDIADAGKVPPFSWIKVRCPVQKFGREQKISPGMAQIISVKKMA